MTDSILDDPAAIARLDPRGMLADITGLAEQCEEAWRAAQQIEAPDGPIDKIVVLGMGGSAIAGDLFRVLLARESVVPVFNVRQYDLPPYVDERTLVIASSYSGNTEETLSAFEQSLSTPAHKLAITSGGKLLTMARANGVSTLTFEFGGEPRAAIGWSLMPLLALANKLGLMDAVEADVDEAIAETRKLRSKLGPDVLCARNEAKQLAVRLHDKLPVIYAGSPLTEIAHRWANQFNESGKVWSFYTELPEAHHNAIVGYGLPRRIAESTIVVMLNSPDLVHRRVQMRYDFTRDKLAAAGVETVDAVSRDGSALAQMMSLLMLGDYVSAYLAFLYDVDPTPTNVIEELRDWLATQD